MKNITGAPAEGGDFFDRPADLALLRRDLDDGASLLMVAPRRVGKTSLALRLCSLEREAGRHAVYLNVEGCSDELAFAERLVAALAESGLHPRLRKRVELILVSMRSALRGVNFGEAGLDTHAGGGPSDSAADAQSSTLGRALESLFQQVETGSTRLLLVLDEVPELLKNLNGEASGEKRVARLLHWLRQLRQTYRRHVRWMFLGSIGLDNFVDRRGLRKTINDLTLARLDALTAEQADQLLEQLGQSYGLDLAPSIRKQIVDRVGWPIPYFLQLVIHELRDLGAATVSSDTVHEAFRALLAPEKLRYFDTWHQRLKDQLDEAELRVAMSVLDELARDERGRQREQLLAGLSRSHPSTDPAELADRLAATLVLLISDGYLLEQNGAYSFRSFLLREYWFARRLR